MNDRERGEELARILTHYRGDMTNRAAFTARYLLSGVPRYERLLRETLRHLNAPFHGEGENR